MSNVAHLLFALSLLLPQAPAEERITFVLPFPEEQGGGQAEGAAGALDYREEDYAELTGGVEIVYQDMVFRAETVAIDLSTKELTAAGNVIVDQGPNRLTGSFARFDLDEKTGELTQASVATREGFYFAGDKVAKIGEDRYRVERGILTSCEGAVPAWSFGVREATVQVEGYAFIEGASMRVKSAPVFYVPWLVWPAKTERSSGLLIPKVGTSNDKGTHLGLAYYQVLGRSWDTTLFTDLYSEEFLGLGSEIRYHPSEGTIGSFRGYAIDDPGEEDWRWKVAFDHWTTDLPWDFRGVVHYEEYSDFRFFRDFERDLNAKSRSFIYSNAYLSRNWGNQSFNILLDSRERFLGGSDSVTLQQLPEIEYEMRPTRIGRTPLYFALDTAAHYLDLERTETYQGRYGRFHLAPTLRLPWSPATWLSLSVNARPRLTWYETSLVEAEDGSEDPFPASPPTLAGGSLTRILPEVGIDAVGPSFSRIFDKAPGRYDKLKHLVEPRLSYFFADEYAEQDLVPVFDELDTVSSFHEARFSIINRLLAKVEDGEESEGRSRRRRGRRRADGVTELLTLEIGRSYSFDDFLESGTIVAGDETETRESRLGPLDVDLRAFPSDNFSLQARARYSLLFDQISTLRLSGSTNLWGRNRLDFGWSPRWRDTDGELVTNQGTLGWVLEIVPGRLALRSALSYDFDLDLLRDQRHFLTWAGSCYTLRFELHESQTADRRRRDVLFSVDLKNVGTFLDLTGGESEGF